MSILALRTPARGVLGVQVPCYAGDLAGEGVYSFEFYFYLNGKFWGPGPDLSNIYTFDPYNKNGLNNTVSPFGATHKKLIEITLKISEGDRFETLNLIYLVRQRIGILKWKNSLFAIGTYEENILVISKINNEKKILVKI